LGGAERNPTLNAYNHVLDVGLRSSTQPTHNQRFCFLSDESNRRALKQGKRKSKNKLALLKKAFSNIVETFDETSLQKWVSHQKQSGKIYNYQLNQQRQ
jgi:hypothetical protein